MIAELTSWLMSTGCKWDLWRSADGTVCVMLFTGDDILNGVGPNMETALATVRAKYERLEKAA